MNVANNSVCFSLPLIDVMLMMPVCITGITDLKNDNEMILLCVCNVP